MTNRPLRGAHCRCSACGAFFNSAAPFDWHRTGPYSGRRCLGADEMAAKGMVLNAGGWWVTAPLKMAPAYLYRDSRSGDQGEGASGERACS